jgi:hypothetical protein
MHIHNNWIKLSEIQEAQDKICGRAMPTRMNLRKEMYKGCA